MFRLLGRLAFFAATLAFLTATSLLLLGSFLMTWPILRKSPRQRKLSAAAELTSAGLAMLAAFGDARERKWRNQLPPDTPNS